MKNHVIAILLFLCTCFLVACNVEPTIEETNDSEKCQDTLRVQLDNFINSHKFDTICINEQWINSVKNPLNGLLIGNVFAGFIDYDTQYDTVLTSVLFSKNMYDVHENILVVKMQFPIFSPNVKYEDVLFLKSDDYLITDFYPGYCVIDFYMPAGDNLLTEGIYSLTAEEKPYQIINSRNCNCDKSCIFGMPLITDYKNFSMNYDFYHDLTEAFMKFEIVDGKYNLQYWLNVENMMYLYCYLDEGREKNIPDELKEIKGLTIMNKGYEYCISNPK